MNNFLNSLKLRQLDRPYETLDWGLYKGPHGKSAAYSSSKYFYLFDNKVYYLSSGFESSVLELNYYSLTDDRYYHYIDLPNKSYDSIFVNSFGIMIWNSGYGSTNLCTIVNGQLKELEFEGDLVGICDDEVYISPKVTDLVYNTLVRTGSQNCIISYNIRTGQQKEICPVVYVSDNNQDVMVITGITSINKDYFLAELYVLNAHRTYSTKGLFSFVDAGFSPIEIKTGTDCLFDTRYNEFWVGKELTNEIKYEKFGAGLSGEQFSNLNFFGDSSITIPKQDSDLFYFNGRDKDIWFGHAFSKFKFNYYNKEVSSPLPVSVVTGHILKNYPDFFAIADEKKKDLQLNFFDKLSLNKVFSVKREMIKAKINSANSVSPTTSRSSRIEVSPPIEVSTPHSTAQESTFGFGNTIKTMTYKNVVATGRVEGSGFVVLKGSQIVTGQSQKSCSPKVKAMREEFLRHNPSGILQQDMHFNSSSQAAGFVGGASLSGNANWK